MNEGGVAYGGLDGICELLAVRFKGNNATFRFLYDRYVQSGKFFLHKKAYFLNRNKFVPSSCFLQAGNRCTSCRVVVQSERFRKPSS